MYLTDFISDYAFVEKPRAHLDNKKPLTVTWSNFFDHLKSGWFKYNVACSKLLNKSRYKY